jgi:hypothetical protein
VNDLRIKLARPMSKYQYGYSKAWSLETLYKSYYGTIQHLDARLKKLDGLSNEINLLREDYANKSNACEVTASSLRIGSNE